MTSTLNSNSIESLIGTESTLQGTFDRFANFYGRIKVREVELADYFLMTAVLEKVNLKVDQLSSFQLDKVAV